MQDSVVDITVKVNSNSQNANGNDKRQLRLKENLSRHVSQLKALELLLSRFMQIYCDIGRKEGHNVQLGADNIYEQYVELEPGNEVRINNNSICSSS